MAPVARSAGYSMSLFMCPDLHSGSSVGSLLFGTWDIGLITVLMGGRALSGLCGNGNLWGTNM